MKQLFTKVVSIMAIVAAFAAAPMAAHADTNPLSFNTKVGDQEFLTGRDVTQNGTFTDPVNNVVSSDLVDVAVYYHNADEDTDANVAKNVHIQVTLPTDSSSSHVLTGILSADNVPAVHGTIVNGQEVGKPNLTINTTAATTVSMVPGSVRWYPNEMTTTGKGASLPNGQNGDTITTSGINIGDLRGCFQYSGYVIFTVKFTGVVVQPAKAILTLKKEVHTAGSADAFVTEDTVTPGDELEYRLTINNIDGAGIAKNIVVKDVLPQGLTYVGPTILTRSGTATTLPDGITTTSGIQVVSDLQPLEQITITFKVNTVISFANNACVTNTASVTADNATLPNPANAETCFSVKPAPTPTPVATPTPSNPPVSTPKPTLPKTGPEMDFPMLLGLAGVTGTFGRYSYLKKQVKKQARDISVL